MKPEDSRHGFADDAYIARPGWRANLPILVACVAVDVFLLYRTVRYPEPGLAVLLVVFGVVTTLVAFFITRSIRRGDVSFAVDSGGVYFGPTDRETQSVLIPWSWIECIVTFDLIAYEGKQRVRRRCVGAELNAKGVTER